MYESVEYVFATKRQKLLGVWSYAAPNILEFFILQNCIFRGFYEEFPEILIAKARAIFKDILKEK